MTDNTVLALGFRFGGGDRPSVPLPNAGDLHSGPLPRRRLHEEWKGIGARERRYDRAASTLKAR